VLEMNEPAGEIRELCKIAKPMCVVTNVGYAHIEFFDSIDGSRWQAGTGDSCPGGIAISMRRCGGQLQAGEPSLRLRELADVGVRICRVPHSAVTAFVRNASLGLHGALNVLAGIATAGFDIPAADLVERHHHPIGKMPASACSTTASRF